MNSNSLPEQLVPDDCDLRDFQFMPMDIMRLFNSGFHARANDSEWRAGVTLWLKSYHQVPAASIPDDDVLLARLAEYGRDVNGWKEVKDVALSGWIKCDDGRLYHPVVAEKVLEAWIQKIQQRWKSAKGNAAKHNKLSLDDKPFIDLLNQASEMLKAISPSSKYIRFFMSDVSSKENSSIQKDAIQGSHVGDHEGDFKGNQQGLLQVLPQGDQQGTLQGSQETGTETGTETEIIKPVLTHTYYPSQQSRDENENNSQELSDDPPPAEPQSPPGKPTPAAIVCLSIKKQGIIDINPAHPKLLMLIESGATVDEFMHAARTAKDKGKGFAYVLGIVKGQRTDAESAKGKVLQGDLPNRSPPLASNRQALMMAAGRSLFAHKDEEKWHEREIEGTAEFIECDTDKPVAGIVD